MPFFKRAVELDPNFAMAHARLGTVYGNMGQRTLAAESTRQAYELRDKVTERERLYIESHYFSTTLGDLEKARQIHELWEQTYPKDPVPYANLSTLYDRLGDQEKELEQARRYMPVDPDSVLAYDNLAGAYLEANRFDQVEAILKQAAARNYENEGLFFTRYRLAFLQGNQAEMERMLASASGNPALEGLALSLQSEANAWYGQVRKSRDFRRRAMEVLERTDEKEVAATQQATAAVWQAAMDNREQARADANSALKLAPGHDVQALAAIALARAGDISQAEKLAAELEKLYPQATLVQVNFLPTIRAAAALERKNPDRTIELLQPTLRYELGVPTQWSMRNCSDHCPRD